MLIVHRLDSGGAELEVNVGGRPFTVRVAERQEQGAPVDIVVNEHVGCGGVRRIVTEVVCRGG